MVTLHTCTMHVCASRPPPSRHPTCHASYIQGFTPQAQTPWATAAAFGGRLPPQQHTMMLACCALQMFPHLKVEVSEFHSNSGRCVVGAGTRASTAQTASHFLIVLG